MKRQRHVELSKRQILVLYNECLKCSYKLINLHLVTFWVIQINNSINFTGLKQKWIFFFCKIK